MKFKHLKYLSYVIRHKFFVLIAGLKTGAPLWRLLIHDWSKLLPSEWFPYAEKFYGVWAGTKVREDHNTISCFICRSIARVEYAFDRAWLHHQRRNKHHWQYWVLRNDDGTTRALQMPEKYAREMVADWMGAGRAITGKWGASQWYFDNRSKMTLHSKTEQFVEYMLWLHD
jgi:hypothetical protein